MYENSHRLSSSPPSTYVPEATWNAYAVSATNSVTIEAMSSTNDGVRAPGVESSPIATPRMTRSPSG